MSEKFPSPPRPTENEEVPEIKPLSIKERADSPELQVELEDMEREARLIEEQLASAFPNPQREDMPVARDFMRDRLWDLARRARTFGRHYNMEHPYLVGASMLGVRTSDRLQSGKNRPWIVTFDANTRLREDLPGDEDPTKLCAEGHLMARAQGGPERVDQIVQILVAAPARFMADDPVGLKDDKSQRSQITLTPCRGVCIPKMLKLSEGEHPLISPTDTEIYTRRSDEWEAGRRVEKFQKVADLERFHTLKRYERTQGVQEI